MKNITQEQFVAALGSAGITDDQKKRLHARLEKDHPEAHQGFLEYLGVPALEIREIRERSRQG